MYGIEICPRCMQTIAPERLIALPKICDHCGFVATPAERAVQRHFERTSLIGVVIAAAVIVIAFVELVNWGGYTLEVIPLQAQALVGMDSVSGIERMAQICLEVKKFDCTERMYMRLAVHDQKALPRLAKFQFNRMKYAEAAESYRQFFAAGNQDLDAAYVYARALGELGRVDEAAKYFDYVLASKPGTLQVTVATNYVTMLVRNNRPGQALKVIEGIRKLGESASQFMASEYNVIRGKLGQKS